MTLRDQLRDVGNGLVCASFGAGGEWLDLGTVDPARGFVELTGLPPFDEAGRGDPDAVRRYRSWMHDPTRAFLTVDVGPAAITTRQLAPPSTRGLIQHVSIEARPTDHPTDIVIRFSGRLARPAYGEITEVDPPRWSTEPTRLEVGTNGLLVLGEGPPVLVQAQLREAASPSSVPLSGDLAISWRVLRGRIPAAEARIAWPVGASEVRFDIACTFDLPIPPRPGWATLGRASEVPQAGAAAEMDRTLVVPARLFEASQRISQRALDYVRSCTALQVAGAERCILADHRILPLSWTRDAYWQARLLLVNRSLGEDRDDARIVADHLRWLFLRCERPDGRWVRSHFADGTRKDSPFQADQQMYPILELLDYLEATGLLPELPREAAWGDLVATAWAGVEGAIDEDLGLIRTDENPADDTLNYPFLLSNQVLLWWVARRLATAAGKLGVSKEQFAELAARTQTAVEELLVVEGPLGMQWAYAVDAHGRSELSHDANDLPVALAPLWGFCDPDSPVWRTTMRFAVDPANPGFVPGSHGGLGSRHTPGTWTLGDIQRWVGAALAGDQAGSEAALERLTDVAALNDGMLPEAYAPDGSGRLVRRWFAWPGAAFGALFGEHGRTRLS